MFYQILNESISFSLYNKKTERVQTERTVFGLKHSLCEIRDRAKPLNITFVGNFIVHYKLPVKPNPTNGWDTRAQDATSALEKNSSHLETHWEMLSFQTFLEILRVLIWVYVS